MDDTKRKQSLIAKWMRGSDTENKRNNENKYKYKEIIEWNEENVNIKYNINAWIEMRVTKLRWL